MANRTISLSEESGARQNETASARGEPAGGSTMRRNWLLLLVVLGLVGGGIGIWDSVKYRFIPKRFGVVVPGEIYRSGQISRWMFEPTVHEYEIDTVIDLNGVAKNDLDQQAEIASYDTLDLNHYRFKLHGNGTGDVDNYISAIATLAKAHRNGEAVLVHCHAGAQRTGSVISAYRVLVLGHSPKDVYVAMQRYGWDPESDQALLQYLNANLPKVAEALVEKGILERVPDPIPVVGP